MTEEQQQKLSVISAETAGQLLHSLCSKKKLAPVNVQGKVLAVSEVTLVKGSCLLLVKLYSGINIVIKNKDKLQWQPLLVPHREYVITKLRLTTLEKFYKFNSSPLGDYIDVSAADDGCRRPCRVYTVTDRSQLFSHDSVDVDLVPINQWLDQIGLSETTLGPAPALLPKISDTLFSYQGTITDVLDRALGVFELDKQASLTLSLPLTTYVVLANSIDPDERALIRALSPLSIPFVIDKTWQVPSAEKVALLQVGDVITVHNVHYRQAKQNPKLILYSCMLGNICVEKHSTSILSSAAATVADKAYRQNQSLPPTLQKYLYLYGLSQQKLDFLYILRKSLKDQFLDRFGRRNLEKLMATILSLPLLSWKQCTEGPYRNLLDEFIHIPHTCSLDEEKKQQTLPLFKTIKEVLLQDLPKPDNTTGQWNSATHVVDKEILLGVLKTCEKSGQSMIYDATGSVPIVTCCCYGKQVKCDHSTDTVCSLSCCCKDMSKGKFLACSRLHTCCNRKVVVLKNFVIVTETLNANHNSVFTKNTKHKQYICADLKNAVMLGDISKYEKQACTSIEKDLKAARDVPKQGKVNVVTDKNTDKLQIDDDVEIIECTSFKRDDSKCSERAQIHVGSKGTSTTKEPKTYLHRHIEENGRSRFCRKTECIQNVKDSGDSGLPIVEHYSAMQNTDKTMIDCGDGSGLIYSVKPINKRRGIDLSILEEAENLKKVKQNEAIGSNVFKNLEEPENIEKMKQIVIKGRTENEKKGLLSVENNKTSDAEKMKDKEEIKETLPSNCVDILVVSKEALRPDGQNVDEGTLMFCAECRMIGEDSNAETIIAMFNGRAIQWYPFLYNGHAYRLTCAEGNLPLNTPKVLCNKVQKALKKSKAKSWKLVHCDVNIEEKYGENNTEDTNLRSKFCKVSTVLSLGYRGSFVSICGVVTKRVIVDRDQQAPKPTDIKEPSGCVSINTRVDVQEVDGRDILQVYMDHRSYCIPLGLIPSAIVRFTNLERKVSRSGNVYCRFVALSSVEVVCISSENLTNHNQPVRSCDIETGVPLPRMHLVDRWQHHDRKSVFQCACDVSQISKLSLKCLCEYCGATIVRSKCSNTSCFGGEEAKMLARASVLVDDGTTVAMVTMTGSSVQDLLQLSHDHWACLEAEIKITGEIFVQQARQMCESPLVQFVNMLCDNSLVKQPWLMTLRHKYTGRDTLDQIGIDEFAQKTFDTGSGRITTHCLPFLQLECVTMETFDPTLCATYYLANAPL